MGHVTTKNFFIDVQFSFNDNDDENRSNELFDKGEEKTDETPEIGSMPAFNKLKLFTIFGIRRLCKLYRILAPSLFKSTDEPALLGGESTLKIYKHIFFSVNKTLT